MLGQVLLGKYRVSRLLDQGGMCKIWLATQIDVHREVVVKVLQEQFLGQSKPREFFRRLGIKEPPERGAYFVDLWQHRKNDRKLDPGEFEDFLHDEIDRCTRTPWTRRQHPEMAAWLAANEKPLALAVGASNRPRYYFPVLPPKTGKGSAGLLAAPLSGVQTCRGLANALAARAMLRVGDGRPEDAWLSSSAPTRATSSAESSPRRGSARRTKFLIEPIVRCG